MLSLIQNVTLTQHSINRLIADHYAFCFIHALFTHYHYHQEVDLSKITNKRIVMNQANSSMVFGQSQGYIETSRPGLIAEF